MAVLTGAEGTFCAGADLKALAEGDRRPIPDDGPGPMGPTRLTLTKPVIAAVEGFAVAGGIELALWCDLQGGRRGRRLRRVLPALRGAAVRPGNGPPAPDHRARAGHGPDPDRARRGGARGPADRPGEPDRGPRCGTPGAVDLARQLAALPQFCLRSDRMSMIEQWGITEEEAAVNEARRGRAVVDSGETREGAQRFAGRGRARCGATLA